MLAALYRCWTKTIITDLAHFLTPAYLHLCKAESGLGASALTPFSPVTSEAARVGASSPPRAPACGWACRDRPPDDTVTPKN